MENEVLKFLAEYGMKGEGYQLEDVVCGIAEDAGIDFSDLTVELVLDVCRGAEIDKQAAKNIHFGMEEVLACYAANMDIKIEGALGLYWLDHFRVASCALAFMLYYKVAIEFGLNRDPGFCYFCRLAQSRRMQGTIGSGFFERIMGKVLGADMSESGWVG